MDGMVLSFDETQRVRQIRQRSSGAVPTLARAEPPAQPYLTAVRPTAVEPPKLWQKIWQGMPCVGSAEQAPTPAKPTGGVWVTCNPPIPISSLDGLRVGYQVRTTQGMDIIYGVPMPTANDATEMVTMYRDLTAVADAQP
jgi:hypothetical protein